MRPRRWADGDGDGGGSDVGSGRGISHGIFVFFEKAFPIGPTCGPTDRPSYRDARTHLKREV